MIFFFYDKLLQKRASGAANKQNSITTEQAIYTTLMGRF